MLESGLSQNGYKAPNARKTGTTIAGIVFKVRMCHQCCYLESQINERQWLKMNYEIFVGSTTTSDLQAGTAEINQEAALKCRAGVKGSSGLLKLRH